MKIGTEVRTPLGRGYVRKIAHDVKFDRTAYFIDVIKSDSLARITRTKYETVKFWEYEIKEVTK